MAGSLLEAVARARDRRRKAGGAYDKADDLFQNAILQASRAHTWNEIAEASGLTRHRVRQLVYQIRKETEEPWTTSR